MENILPVGTPKKKDYGKIGGALVILFVLFLSFGNIPVNYYNSYKRVQIYKTELFQCGNALSSEDKKVLENKICDCVYNDQRLKKDDDIKLARTAQKEYYDAMRLKYNLSGIFVQCEYRDARNDALLR
ncbi:MAG: hypothetical protein A2538_03265 [Candidatus Magasanikbacteria bacterium RIFOXYD2_FULL_41_14]|uniref:Uncharacterized protein n=1 Tax=Candidatus Magasanikbacteria bacterium RIFOXYD2_FULL_41_14 TaxID=1798709 RepID=A0A1F6PCF9_9BACT|nr:MAG: hypothetical protein A2538_03265 [Candidatus Magasanikbacteria bacterium RIFOXYD2_FULL_41_14]